MAATQRTTLGAVGGGDLRAAAEEIAKGARELAAPWAKTGAVVASIRVEMTTGRTALIIADAPGAYPNETGVRHPVFADRNKPRTEWTWVPGNLRPFLGPAADLRAGAAMARYARKIDRLCREAGFK